MKSQNDIPKEHDAGGSGALLGNRFEQLCRQLLERDGYEVEAATPAELVDFIARAPDGQITLIAEAKLYRSAQIDWSTLRNALYHLSAAGERVRASRKLLIVNITAPAALAEEATRAGVDVWDLGVLTSKLTEYPSLQRHSSVYCGTPNRVPAGPPRSPRP